MSDVLWMVFLKTEFILLSSTALPFLCSFFAKGFTIISSPPAPNSESIAITKRHELFSQFQGKKSLRISAQRLFRDTYILRTRLPPSNAPCFVSMCRASHIHIDYACCLPATWFLLSIVLKYLLSPVFCTYGSPIVMLLIG